MKAVVVEQFGPPEVLRLRDVAMPVAREGQVLVRLHAIGVNPVETYIRSGQYAVLPALPYTPGTDAAGVTGDGRRVYLSGSLTGTYAEYALCEPQHLHPLPQDISFAQGAAVNIPYATAYRALFEKARVQPGETVLVHGASGGVGIAAVQFAVAHGCRVIGTAGSAAGMELVRQQGADTVLDHRNAGHLEGISVDVIVEMLANVNLARDLTALARGGRLAVVGNRGTIEINPREIMRREAAVLGVFLANATAEESARAHAAIGAGLRAGWLRPVVGRELALAEAARAHTAVLDPGAQGKIVLIP